MATVKVGNSGLNPVQLVAKATLIHGKMTGNANFLTPIPDLATFLAAITALSSAISAASGFDRNLIIAKNLRDKELRLLIKQLAAYVQSASNGDADKIISSGFELRKQRGPKVQMTQVQNLVAESTLTEGEIDLSWDPVTAAKAFELEYKDLGFTGDGGSASIPPGMPGTPTPGAGNGEWKHLESVTASRYLATGLISGHIYQFRVRALGATGHGAMSDIAQVRAR
ncbi:MAG: hypothetical protein POELPBGB_00123 [Bacteroidia bacterium]|nr:hypothetical protein [Bacteroidia bacterium]